MRAMINRIILLVLDGLGIGALPDASHYGDAECNTLASLCEASGSVHLPNLENLGLGHLGQFQGIRPMVQPEGCFGLMGFVSKGKDSLIGHWEIAGCPIETVSGVSDEAIPALVAVIEGAIGQKTLGNRKMSGANPVQEMAVQHKRSGVPIVWFDDVGTIHLAAHETIVPAEELYRMGRDVRRAAKAAHPIVRVVAHPFDDQAGMLWSGSRRRDFATEPPATTLLDLLSRASQLVVGLGKIGDLFSGRGVTRSATISEAGEALDEIIGMLNRVPRGLIFANLEVLVPSLEDSVRALHEVDRRLPELQERWKTGDLLIITADHGFDMSRPTWGHSREYVPLLITGPKLARGVNLGTRQTAADLGQTIGEALGASRLPSGDSFLDSLHAG